MHIAFYAVYVNCYATKQMKKNIGLEMKEIFEKCILILVTF